MSFGMIKLNQTTNTKQNYSTWILVALLLILLLKTFLKTLTMMLQDDLIHLTMIRMTINKKVIGMFKDELGGKIMKKFVRLQLKHMHI